MVSDKLLEPEFKKRFGQSGAGERGMWCSWVLSSEGAEGSEGGGEGIERELKRRLGR